MKEEAPTLSKGGSIGNDSPLLVSYGDTPGRDSQDSFSTAAFLKQEMTEEKRKILPG